MSKLRTVFKIRDFMSEHPEQIDDGATLNEARSRMAKAGIRHLPIVGGEGGLKGVLSEGDANLVESLPGVDADEVLAMDAAHASVFTCGPDARIDSVAAEMLERRIGSAIVVDPSAPSHPLGIFTTTDALRALIQFTEPYLRDPDNYASPK